MTQEWGSQAGNSGAAGGEEAGEETISKNGPKWGGMGGEEQRRERSK